MLIQVYVKNEPIQKCDLLIAREDAAVTIPVAELADLRDRKMDVKLVKTHENMGMKAAVLAAEAIASAEAVSSPVFIACPDKAILDGMCSMEYAGPAGGPIKCVPSGTKPQAPPRVRNRAKPKTPAQPEADAAAGAGPEAKPSGEAPADAPEDTGTGAAGTPGAPAAAAGPGPDGLDEVKAALDDPSLVKGGEVNTEPDENAGSGPEAGKPDPTLENTRKIMAILKEKGVPAGQIPGVLEALREAMDANITLPMQVKLKLAKDGATGDMDPEKTAKLVAPAFDELKALLKEIDDHNAAKQ